VISDLLRMDGERLDAWIARIAEIPEFQPRPISDCLIYQSPGGPSGFLETPTDGGGDLSPDGPPGFRFSQVRKTADGLR